MNFLREDMMNNLNTSTSELLKWKERGTELTDFNNPIMKEIMNKQITKTKISQLNNAKILQRSI